MNNGANELKFGHTSSMFERGEMPKSSVSRRGEMPKKPCGLQSCRRNGSTNESSRRQRSLSKGEMPKSPMSNRGNVEKTLWTSKLSLEWEHGQEFRNRLCRAACACVFGQWVGV